MVRPLSLRARPESVTCTETLPVLRTAPLESTYSILPTEFPFES